MEFLGLDEVLFFQEVPQAPPTPELQLSVLSKQWLALRSEVHENSEIFDVIKSVTKAIELIT